jgi:O-antigen/teichoic acid export membrane protein
MSTRKIALSTFWQLASQATMAVLSILATKFVAIGLSKELVGYYNSTYGYLQIFAVIADFGLFAVTVREMSKVQGSERERVFGSLLLLRTIILVLSFVIAMTIVWSVPDWRTTPFSIGVSIAALVPFFTILAGTIRSIFQVEYRMEFVFVAEVLQRILTTLGIGAFIFMGVRLTEDVRVFEWFLWIGSIGAFILFVLSYMYGNRFLRIRFVFDPTLFRKFFLLAAPYGIAYLLLAIYRQFDVVFIAIARDDFAIQNAYYGFAGRVEDMAFLIPTFLLNSTLPILTERLTQGKPVDRLLGKTFMILLLTGSIFLLFSALWAKPFTLLFATPHYLSTADHYGADMAFLLMSVPMLLNGLVLYAFYTFLALHDWQRVMVSFGLGVVVTLALNLLWTPRFGFVGAGGALICAHVFLTVILVPPAIRAIRIRFTLRDGLQWIAYTVILGGILWFIAPLLTSGTKTMIGGMAMLPVLACLAYVLGIHRTLKGEEFAA